MIEINLVPQELRKKRKSQSVSVDFLNLSQEMIVSCIIGLLVFLFILHIFFQLIIFVRFIQHKRLQTRWEHILPEKARADVVISELRGLQNEVNSIEKLKTERKILWSQKLNDISDSIPRGLWLNKLSSNETVLLIDGSAVSKAKDEMASVGVLVSNLKSKKTFISGLQNLELGSVQRRPLKSIDVVDFVISVKLQ